MQNMTLRETLDRSAARHPDKPALIYQGRTLSYGELSRSVDEFAAVLRQKGIGRGNSIGILLPNCPAFITAYFAAASLGAVIVPLNTLYKADEIEYILRDARARLLITSAAHEKVSSTLKERGVLDEVLTVSTRGLTAAEMLAAAGKAEVAAQASGEGAGVCRGLVANRGSQAEAGNPAEAGSRAETRSAAEAGAPGIQESDVAVYLYTSGTTGRPKGAMLSHFNLISNALSTGDFLRITPDDVHVCVLPLFHTLAATVCMLMPICYGGTIILVEQFVPNIVLDLIEEHRATVFTGVPSMYVVFINMADLAKTRLRSLRLCLSGGAPLPTQVLEAWDDLTGIPLVEGYGLSEASPVVSVNPVDGRRKPGSVGLPITNVEVRILDEDGNEVPTGTVGEICVKGPNVMSGYVGRPQDTAEVLRGGWLHTGDLGYRDEDGYIFIVDRKKDMIIVGGLNVYPREIEEVLYRHPAVKEAAVIGVPHPVKGEVPVAFIAPKEGAAVDEKEMLRFLRERLANYKVPASIEVRDSLPKTSTGKILKRALKPGGGQEEGQA